MGQAATAPVAGLALFKRAAWVAEHHWTFEQYDNAKAADILWQDEYERLVAARRQYQEQLADAG